MLISCWRVLWLIMTASPVAPGLSPLYLTSIIDGKMLGLIKPCIEHPAVVLVMLLPLLYVRLC
jgi:hypothetical protein